MTQGDSLWALVLSGGRGRGAYQVGALRFLDEHDCFIVNLWILVGVSYVVLLLASDHSGERKIK